MLLWLMNLGFAGGEAITEPIPAGEHTVVGLAEIAEVATQDNDATFQVDPR